MAKREREDFWLDRPMTKRDKKMIAILIISIYFILLMTINTFRAYNLHMANYLTYYIEFGAHVVEDKIHNEHTEFVFIPLNIGFFDFGVADKLSNIKSKTVEKYNSQAIGDGITKSIAGKTMDETVEMISKGY